MDDNSIEAIQARHERSKRIYPHVNLSDGEYVVIVIKRHWMAIAGQMIIGIILLALLWTVQFNFDLIAVQLGLTESTLIPMFLLISVIFLTALVAAGMWVSYYVYDNNRVFLTNESVIQHIQFSLLSKREQVIGLGNVEDLSYSKAGLLAYLFDYGTIRLSTVGDEQTYAQTYIPNPKDAAAELNHAVELFKKGHPIPQSDSAEIEIPTTT